jgi:sulfate permease, SulP family
MTDSSEPIQDECGDESSPFRPAGAAPLLERAIPVAGELPKYRSRTARGDVLAGVTVAALALPAAMAYAEVAGLSPVHGLYALLLPALAYALFGSSRQLILGPEGSIAALIAAAVLPLAAAGSDAAAETAAMLALLVGGCFLIARLLRLGWIADYFSRPVLIGYIHGVVVVLIVGQLGKVFGIPVDARDPLGQLADILRGLGDASGVTVLVGAVALAVLLALRVAVPLLPAALIVVCASILLSWAFDFSSHGVAVLGPIPSGLPSFDIPSVPGADVLALLPAAVGIFLVSFADGILTARSFAGKHDQSVQADQELVAFGAANIAAGLTQGFSIGASGSRTAVNDSMGARTQISGLIAAAAVALVLLFLTEPMQYLPKAVLGAVIISAALGLIDTAAWRAISSVGRVEVAIAAVTMAGVVLFGVLEALVVAVALSVLDTVRRSAQPHDAVLGWVERLGRYANVELHPSATVTPGVVVYRLDDRLFFANARYVKGRIREAVRGAAEHVNWLVFDAEAVTHVDATGVAALEDLERLLARDGITLLLARMKGPLEARLEGTSFGASMGQDRRFATVRAAVEYCVAHGSSSGAAPRAAPPERGG